MDWDDFKISIRNRLDANMEEASIVAVERGEPYLQTDFNLKCEDCQGHFGAVWVGVAWRCRYCFRVLDGKPPEW